MSFLCGQHFPAYLCEHGLASALELIRSGGKSHGGKEHKACQAPGPGTILTVWGQPGTCSLDMNLVSVVSTAPQQDRGLRYLIAGPTCPLGLLPPKDKAAVLLGSVCTLLRNCLCIHTKIGKGTKLEKLLT